MGVIKKATVPDSSIGVDVGQPLTKNNNEIIANISTQNNLQATEKLSTGQFPGCMATNSPVNSGQSGLETISMDELYDAVYPPKIPIVDGLIYNGTYLFVGAPKVGKSFFMAQLGYHVSKGLCIFMTGCGNLKAEEGKEITSSDTVVEHNTYLESESTEVTIDETIEEHLFVQTNFQSSSEDLPLYDTELKQFDSQKVASIIWSQASENEIQKEEMDDKSVTMNYEDGVLAVNSGVLLYRRNNDTSYYDTLLSYASKENRSEEKDLEFMTKEEAQNEVESILSQLEIGGELKTPTIVCASKNDLSSIQDTMRNDEDYSSLFVAKQIDEETFDNTKGFYYFKYDFCINSVPVYASNAPSVQMMGDMDRALLAYPMQAIVIISEKGIEEIQLMGALEQLDDQSKKFEIIQYEGIREALEKKYGDVILTDDYKVIRIWMEYFPLIKADSFSEVELIPVWCCDFEINGETGLDYTIRFNAITGEEIS